MALLPSADVRLGGRNAFRERRINRVFARGLRASASVRRRRFRVRTVVLAERINRIGRFCPQFAGVGVGKALF